MSKHRPQPRVILPNVFTALNVFCGFLSIIYSARAPMGTNAIDPAYVTASWLILMAVIFDTLDGNIARLTKGFSDFGVEFDSLSDIVSFGVAPSILIYKLYFFQSNEYGIFFSFLPLLFGGIRLARFNVQIAGFEKKGFSGLPIPTTAYGIASIILLATNDYFPFAQPFEFFQQILPPAVIVFSLLMVTNFPYDALPKFRLKSGWYNISKLVFLLISIIMIIIFPRLVLFPLVIIYVLSGIIACIVRFVRHNLERQTPDSISVANPRKIVDQGEDE